MAQISTNVRDTVFSIGKWLGINENPDGDTALKMGEAAEMRNFRITQDGHLQKRPGVKTVLDLGAPCMGLWTGYVSGRQVTLAAAGGKVYELAEDKVELGEVGTGRVHFFGYSDIVYIMDGEEYRKWDGTTYGVVEGYRPMVAVSVVPEGGGATLEQVNKLNGLRRCRYSPDGTATEFKLPETAVSVDYVRDVATGDGLEYTAGETSVTFATAPVQGVNTIEVGYTVATNYRSTVTAMRYSELFNGSTDNRVFLYGDGTNKAIYSGLDYNGQPTAEYFPDLNEILVGESNTPITGMVRQYSRLIVYKTNSAYSVAYGSLTLESGSVTAGFYLSTVNRSVGNLAPGQVRLVTNYPRTLHGGGVYEWKNGSYGMTNDERQAKRISARVEVTLAGFDFTRCVTFENEYKQDYYIVCGDTAVIHNYSVDAWFIYTNFPASAFTMIDGEMYVGTSDGRFCHVSREYMSDDGDAIDAFWRSGSMDFGQEWRRKYSTMIFVVMKPEAAGRIGVTVWSDRKADYTQRFIACSLSTFSKVNFARFSFNTNRRSQVERAKIKVKNFSLYQLVFTSNSASERSTIESVDFRLRYAGYVK